MKVLSKALTVRGVAVVAVLAAGGWLAWKYLPREKEGAQSIVSGNGRIEATEIDVAAKYPGRLVAVLVDEGDFVTAGQVVAQVDTESLNAQLAQAQAQELQAQSAVGTAQSQLAERESQKAAAQARVAQRKAELTSARAHAARTTALAEKQVVARQTADDDVARAGSAEAAISAARADVAATDAAIATARSQIAGAEAAAKAATAAVDRMRVDIGENELKAPRDSRVQFRVAQPGEVLGGGGKVLNLIDLSDVYMTFFLPESVAGKVALGSEVRIVLDVAPDLVIPAKVSFVASTAQFTPKTVETASERQKLMFRVKAQIDRELLKRHLNQVKTGLPGVAWLKVDEAASWPANLTVRVPE